MQIVRAYPPMFDKIAAAFPNLRDGSPIFAWGDTIYQPFEQHPIGPELMAHEGVHTIQQTSYVDPQDGERGITAWWLRYIADPRFRLEQEIAAHRAELGVHYLQSSGRPERRRHLHNVAKRLCHTIYNWPPGLINLERAKSRLREDFSNGS